MTNIENTQEVLIVGAGPVGLVCALGLAQAGLKCTVIDEVPGVVHSPRAIVYHWSVLAGLDRLGILNQAIARGFCKTDYSYKVHKSGETISWDIGALKGHVEFPFNIHLPQNILAEIILEELKNYPDVSVDWGTGFVGLEQDGDGVTVNAKKPDGSEITYKADWVIGADGARSPVRHALGLPFDGTTWEHRFVATNIRADLEPLGYARSVMLIDDVYGAVVVKINNDNLWRCTFAEKADLPEESVLERIPEMFANIIPEMGDDYELVQYSPYRMHQRAASSFRKGRVMLAGDAAHSTNPTGGLGLTSGLFDSYILYEALAAIIKGQENESILDKYSDERRRIFLETTSPRAIENCNFLYHSGDLEVLEKNLQNLRRMANDEPFMLEKTLFTMSMETPSLITGLRTNEGVKIA